LRISSKAVSSVVAHTGENYAQRVAANGFSDRMEKEIDAKGGGAKRVSVVHNECGNFAKMEDRHLPVARSDEKLFQE